MRSMALRNAYLIGREFPSQHKVDRVYARKVARYLLGVDQVPPSDELYDPVVVEKVKSMLRSLGYCPPCELGWPWTPMPSAPW